MEDPTSTTSHISSDQIASSSKKCEGLIDIPFTEKVIDSLIGLFDYFDFHAYKMQIVYMVVTYFRFFQLIGCSFMSGKQVLFKPGTLTYKVMNVLVVLFHVVPLQYRKGHGYIIVFAINVILIFFAIYLVLTALHYKKSSKVSRFSKDVLSIFMAIFPFLLLPLTVQFTGQIISGFIMKKLPTDTVKVVAVCSTVVAIYSWIWIIQNAHSQTLVMRQCSFQAIEGPPQSKLLLTTTLITFVTGLTTYFSVYPTISMIIFSMLLYCYCISSCFHCATFVRKRDQKMVFSGCLIGIIILAANIYGIYTKTAWGPYYYIGVAIIILIVIIFVNIFFKLRDRKLLAILDEIDDTSDISILKNFNRFKEILQVGFIHCHPVCNSFKIFKLASEEWSSQTVLWGIYAKFTAIYPELTDQLTFIANSVANAKANDKMIQSIILSSIQDILRTRETKLTSELKGKISKISKLFNKTKGRLRNVWDLTLQGNIIDMNKAIKISIASVGECEDEMNHILMQYHKNKYVMRQYISFLNFIKGDPVAAKQAYERLIKLSKGVDDQNDKIHELGMIAFPNILEYVTSSENIRINDPETTFTMDDYGVDDTVDIKTIESISEEINHQKIPAIQYIYITSILAFLIVIFTPLLAMELIYYPYSKELEIPISFMKGIAHTRDIFTMITAYTSRYLMIMLNDPKNMSKKMIYDIGGTINISWDAFGGADTTKGIIQYLAQYVSNTNAEMTSIRSYKPHDSYIEHVRDLIFKSITPYTYYINSSYYTIKLASVSDISYMVTTTVGKLCDMETLTPDDAAGSDSLTARNNLSKPFGNLNEALETMISFLKKLNENYQKIFIVVIVLCIVLNIFTYIFIYTTQYRKLNHNRNEILTTLTTLPKAVISAVSASYTKVKGDEKMSSSSMNIELSKQEESIIKLFSKISDDSAEESIYIVNGLCFLCLMIMGCVSYYISMTCYIDSSNNIVYNCHHIDYLFGANAYLHAIIAKIYNIALAKYDPIFENTIASLEEEINRTAERLPHLVNYFEFIRLGGDDVKEVPFPEMQTYIDEATEELHCPSENAPPPNLVESLHCFNAAQQLYAVTSIMKKYYCLITQKIYPDPNDDTLNALWEVGPTELFVTFFYQAGNRIVPIIYEKISSEDVKQKSLTVAVIVLSALLTLIVTINTYNEYIYLKFILKLFLKCPPSQLLNNQRVMDLLSGNYSYKRNDNNSDKFAKFSNEVINKLDDVIIVCQEETNKVITVNASFEEMFGIKKEEIENKNVKEFFSNEKFICSENIDKIFTQNLKMIYKKSETEKVYFEFSSNSFAGKKIFSGLNETQIVNHEKLIQDEKKRSDSMLASILPPMLVPRVQAGEKNISFSVQSATVLFMDIVSFTPWCGSHNAQYVMRMLNIMYKEFDAITNAHKTMTKIKCIGDCYMAAGGIFDDVNQPAVHAKEVVDFGCLAIKKLYEIDERDNESLRIRVGINTGGPIVAGVIGTEKPTFEILGPAINIAHEMESHGVPMNVHISRPVYELIYGQQFNISERGEIDIKNGKMMTYIIDPNQ